MSKKRVFASFILFIVLSILGIVLSLNAKQTLAAFVFTAYMGIHIGFCIVLVGER